MQVTENVGRSTIVLEDDALRVVIDATLGGKIRSFYSKDNEMEYFYTDKRSCFPGSGYSNHDISGLDECFPTIGSCSFPCGEYSGTLIDDHGHLWNMPWELRSHEDTVAMGCDLPEFSVRFDRDCRLEKTGILRFDYRIRNYGKQPLPYLYAAHPMLALHEPTAIRYPREMTRTYISTAVGIPGLSVGAWTGWPLGPEAFQAEPFSGARKTALKCFSDRLTDGTCEVRHHGSGECLRIESDSARLPYLGVMISQEFGPDGECDGDMILGLEPTTSIGDDLNTSQNTRTTAYLAPGEEQRFWIRFSLQAEGASKER